MTGIEKVRYTEIAFELILSLILFVYSIIVVSIA
jgi:hypothetical protein